MDYRKQYNEYLSAAEQFIKQACEVYLPSESRVCAAARYSLLAGGKRTRAVLVLAGCDMLNGPVKNAVWMSAAVEMLHCYSLIHDDLPCMDNDDFRRGKPSCHKAFDYATALLAGDVLLTEAFEVLASAPFSAEIRSDCISALSAGAGSKGMVYGQELDLASEGKSITLEEMEQIHHHKTGDLIHAALKMGALCGGANEKELKAIEIFAYKIGLVFQIVDDILDVTSTTEELGKPVGSDEQNEKSTYVSLLGVSAAMAKATKLNEEACEELRSVFGDKASFLVSLAEELLVRRK